MGIGGKLMKAILLRGPGDYIYTDVENPVCDDRGILIKVKACGLCGSDLRTLKGGHKNVKLPAIIGHEVAGEIIEVGKDYSGIWKVGDDIAVAPVVYCGVCEFCISGRHQYCENIRELAQHWSGGFAEYMAIPPESLACGTLQPVPEGLSYAYVAVAEPPSSCLHAQERLRVGIEDTVVIIGAGPIGCLHICIAKAKGAKKIIVADVNQNRLDLAKIFGPDYLINSSEIDLVEEVKKLTGGMGAEVTITANPIGATQVQAVELAKKAGRIALFGGLPHDSSKPGIDTNIVHYRGLELIGTTSFAPRHHKMVIDLMLSERIPMDKIVTHKLPLSKFDEGVKFAIEGKALKVVFEM